MRKILKNSDGKRRKRKEPNRCRHLCPNNRNINKTQRFVFFMDCSAFTVIRRIVAFYANRIYDAITCLNAPEKIIHLIRTWSRYVLFPLTKKPIPQRARERERKRIRIAYNLHMWIEKRSLNMVLCHKKRFHSFCNSLN